MAKKEKLTKGDQTRELLIRTALRLFSIHGFEQTSFQMIANECQVSQAAPLYHFKSKYGLFEAAIENVVKMRSRLIRLDFQPQDDPRERLLKYIRGLITFGFLHSPENQALILLSYFASCHESFADLQKEILDQQRSEIEEILWAGERQKLFRLPIEVPLASHLIHDFLTGVTVNLLSGRRNAPTMEELESKTITLIDTLTGKVEGRIKK